MTRARASQAGFTLVETLASLTLLALLSLMLIAGAATGRAWSARLGRGAEGESVEAAQQALRSRLEGVFPAIAALSNLPIIDFQGQDDRVDFDAPAPASAGPDAFWRYRLELEPNGDLALLARNDLALDETRYAQRQILLRGVAGLQLAYFGPYGTAGVVGWAGRWQNQSAVPRLVRVRLSFPPGDRRRWPDLVIRPAAELDPACVIEPSTGRCRGRS
jgi:general secretion pathway protein J